MERSCLNCRRPLPHLSRGKNQQYCQEMICQRARKARWQRIKMGSDADYREYQHKAQCAWRAKNPDYWRQYRADNEAYRRREQQRQYRRRHPQASPPPFSGEPSLQQPGVARMDASTPIKPGTYKMQMVGDSAGVAKMDTILVQLIVVQEDRRPQEWTCSCQGAKEGRLSVSQTSAPCPSHTLPGPCDGDCGRSSIDRDRLGGSWPCVPAPT